MGVWAFIVVLRMERCSLELHADSLVCEAGVGKHKQPESNAKLLRVLIERSRVSSCSVRVRGEAWLRNLLQRFFMRQVFSVFMGVEQELVEALLGEAQGRRGVPDQLEAPRY